MHLLSFQTFFLQFSDDEILFDGKGMLIFKIIYSLFNNIFQNYPIPLGGIFDNLGITSKYIFWGENIFQKGGTGGGERKTIFREDIHPCPIIYVLSFEYVQV